MLPLDALGLAANVAQFLDFSIAVVSTTIELRKNGAPEGYAAIGSISRDMVMLVRRLQDGLPRGVLTEDEQALDVLCRKCIKVSQQLQAILKSLELNGNASNWRHSVKKAFKALRGKKKLDNIKKQLESYMDQLDRRVLVNLRTRLDWVSLEQSEAFEKLDQTTQLILQKLREDNQRIEDKLDKVIQSDENICEAISQLEHTNTSEHANTKLAISKQIEIQTATDGTKHDSVVGRFDGVHSDILKALVSVAADNRAEHSVTRAEIQRATDMKVEQIRKELFGSRSGRGEDGAAPAIRIGNVAPVELQKLQEYGTFKLGAWVVKDLVLTCLQGFIQTFSGARVHHEDRPSAPCLNLEPSIRDPRPHYYEQLSLHCPIVSGNIPMINSLIDLGVNVNAPYYWMDIVEGQGQCKPNVGRIARFRWDILDVLANSYFYGGGQRRKRLYLRPLNTAITSNPIHCLSVVQLLLEHGADPSKRDNVGKIPLEYALEARLDGPMKQQLISLLLAHEQIQVLKDTHSLTTLPDIAVKRERFMQAAVQYSNTAGCLDSSNTFTLADIFQTSAAHLRPSLAQVLLKLLAHEDRLYCPVRDGICLLKCAAYTNDKSLIELVVDTIGATNGVEMCTLGSTTPDSDFLTPGFCNPNEEGEAIIESKQIKAAQALRTAVDALDYQSVATFLQAGVSPFVGSLETIQWSEAKEICRSMQHLIPVFGAIEAQDPIMLLLLLSYKRACFPPKWQILVLDYSMIETLPYRRAAQSQLLMVARHVGPKEAIAWAIEKKNEAALEVLLGSSSTWLDPCRNDSTVHALLQQAYDLDLARSGVEELCARWASSS